MTTSYALERRRLAESPRVWLITGVAGFIGSNLLLELLGLGQRVIGIDNFATGHRKNLDRVRETVGVPGWRNFHFVEGDIRSIDDCRRVMGREPTAGQATLDGSRVDVVLHQAALGSVPRSIEHPLATNQANVDGFLNVLVAAKDSGVQRVVYASSSAVYGDHPDLPKIERATGQPLSPYAVSKVTNELYATNFARVYGLEPIGLRYFNVFGPHQDPNGPYAAVVPKWAAALLNGEAAQINGDGETSRDFCYVANAVQANLLAATCRSQAGVNQVYNVAAGQRTTLVQLHRLLCDGLRSRLPDLREVPPVYQDFRPGDVRHSLASIEKARALLGYEPTHTVEQGIHEALEWFISEHPRYAVRVGTSLS